MNLIEYVNIAYVFYASVVVLRLLTLILNLIILLLQVKNFKRLITFKRMLTSMKFYMMKFSTPLPPNQEEFNKKNENMSKKHQIHLPLNSEKRWWTQ